MARTFTQIQQEILSLSSSEKAELLRLLWSELDGQTEPDVEAAWIDEVQRRGQAIDDGQIELIPASQVFEGIEADLRK